MKTYYISRASIKRLVDRIALTRMVIAPVRDGPSYIFKKIETSGQLCLDYPNTIVPPKHVLFPQLETLFTYDVKRGEPRTVGPAHDGQVVLLGGRPCDSSSFSVFDKVMGGEFADPYYFARRERTTIIGLSCSEPASTCFCDVFGSGPVEGTADDISLTTVGDGYIAKPVTNKGTKFIDEFKDLFRQATDEEVRQYGDEVELVKKKLRSQLSVEGLEVKLGERFSDPYWQELGRRCVECGICSFLCPTCYCFDVAEIVVGREGARCRGWDTCQFCTFSRMAGGLDPRPTRADRLKHRFFHKLLYVPRTFGVTSCVGCGRCVSYCPSNVDVREVIKRWS